MERTVNDIKEELLERLDFMGTKPVTGETRLLEDLGMDSLDGYELLYAMESQYDIDVDDRVAVKIETVQDAINVINERLK